MKIMAWLFFYPTTQIEEPITVEDKVLTFERIKGYVTVQYARVWRQWSHPQQQAEHSLSRELAKHYIVQWLQKTDLHTDRTCMPPDHPRCFPFSGSMYFKPTNTPTKVMPR
ncbi:hypothetical protein COCON_G00093650 [Conger conger]|uniref:Uncharacterized protein n=1 Tax=Conger conger TaxID=82655 RepID=A0A9Q1DLH0_CONCO|nr:hypothetical protein COCON_G00093650 [Conger conger]